MKILIDAHLSENRITGIARYLNGLILSMVEQDDSNDYVLILRNDLIDDHPLVQLEARNVTRIYTNISGVNPKNHIHLSRIIKQVDPDIYHHPHFDLPLFQRIKSVVTLHDLKYIRNPHFFPEFSALKKIYMKRMIASSARRANRVISASISTRQDIIDIMNIKEDKIDVIYHGLESKLHGDYSADQRESMIKKYGVDGKYILFVGERRPHKNIPNLIKAYKILKNNLHDNVKLVIIGKKYLNYDVPEKMVNEFEAGQIVMTDSVTDEELAIFYQGAELLVLPSYYEGFGFPLIEAMSHGIPVIAAHNTSMIEVVGDAGLFIDPDSPGDIADKCEQLISDTILRDVLIRAGKENIERFTWEQAAAQTIAVYKNVYSG